MRGAPSDLTADDRARYFNLAASLISVGGLPALGARGGECVAQALVELARQQQVREQIHFVRTAGDAFTVNAQAVAHRGRGIEIAYNVFRGAKLGRLVRAADLYPRGGTRPDRRAIAAMRCAAAEVARVSPELAAEMRAVTCEGGYLTPRASGVARVSMAFQIADSAQSGASVTASGILEDNHRER